MLDELTDLFPNLAGIISNWDASKPANLPAPPEHGGVTDEDMEAYFASRGIPNPQFQPGTSGDAPVAGVEGSDGGTAPIPTPPAPDPSLQAPLTAPETGAPDAPVIPAPETGSEPQGTEDSPIGSQPDPLDSLPEEIEYGDRKIPRDRIKALLAFQDLLEGDEVLQQTLAAYLTTGQVPSSAGPVTQGGGDGSSAAPVPSANPFEQPLVPPEDLDLDDPVIKSLWSVVEQQHGQIAALAKNQLQTSQQFEQRQVMEYEGLVNRAVSSFQQQHQLDDNQIAEIRQVAARMNVLPQFLNGIDPITGLPVRPDPLAGIERSLEVAYYSLPQYRDREFETRQRQRVAENQKRQKLAALNGSSGSVPRTQAAPTTPEGRRQAMAAEVAEMFSGTWSSTDK